jgi:hypothetical protein
MPPCAFFVGSLGLMGLLTQMNRGAVQPGAAYCAPAPRRRLRECPLLIPELVIV